MTVDNRRFRRKIEPKSAWAYIIIACGGISTPEEQEFFGVWKPRRGAYYCTKCHHWHDKLRGVTIASQGAEGKATRDCTCGPSIPEVRGTSPHQRNIQQAVPMRMVPERERAPIRNQIPLPGMPGEGASANISNTNQATGTEGE